jgi:hypothetical protein
MCGPGAGGAEGAQQCALAHALEARCGDGAEQHECAGADTERGHEADGVDDAVDDAAQHALHGPEVDDGYVGEAFDDGALCATRRVSSMLTRLTSGLRRVVEQPGLEDEEEVGLEAGPVDGADAGDDGLDADAGEIPADAVADADAEAARDVLLGGHAHGRRAPRGLRHRTTPFDERSPPVMCRGRCGGTRGARPTARCAACGRVPAGCGASSPLMAAMRAGTMGTSSGGASASWRQQRAPRRPGRAGCRRRRGSAADRRHRRAASRAGSLHDPQRGDEEDAEAERHGDGGGLVARPVQVRDALARGEDAAARAAAVPARRGEAKPRRASRRVSMR